MATSVLEQYNIAQFIEWNDSGQLILNPNFQRRAVWSPSAKVSLIDTVLRRLPIPKVYLRTSIDLKTKKSKREVVDGQQRLRAITEFAQDKFRLSSRVAGYAGRLYSELDPEAQEVFLSYPIAVDQLINASDTDVLEVFSRLNSYTVSLNGQEKRHGKYVGAFRSAVHNLSKAWGAKLWESLPVVSTRNRLRMQDDALTAEMFIIILRGVVDGGDSNIDKVYKEFDTAFPDEERVVDTVNSVLSFMVDHLSDVLEGTIAKAPHFLMLFAACAHALRGIPAGGVGKLLPAPASNILSNLDTVKANLLSINEILESDNPVQEPPGFWLSSKSSTQRVASRRVRFLVYYNALLPEPLVK